MESTQIIKSLKTAFPGYPVDLLNDTACYSYAEKVYGNIKEKNFAFLNFGRGIGATLFTEGSMLGTASGSAIIPLILTVRNVSAEIMDVWRL